MANLAAPVPPALPVSTCTTVQPGTDHKGATTPTPATPTVTIRGLLTGAEEATKEEEGMAEAAAIAESAAAAISWEGSPAEVGVGPGTAGKAVPLSLWKQV
jgi:hypothetical protein